LTSRLAGGPKFPANRPKFFWPKKIYIFWPQTKNRPEISISGRILAICKIFEYAIFGRFFKIFDFGYGQKAEISGVLSKNFFGQKNMYFLAGDQKSTRNFYFRPYYGPVWFSVILKSCQILNIFNYEHKQMSFG